MRSLFLKIFLWFWLGSILVAGVFIGSESWGRTRQAESHVRILFRNMLQLYGGQAVANWELSGVEALRTYAEQMHRETDMQVLLFDEQGAELSGSPLPVGVQEFALQTRKTGSVQFRHADHRFMAAAPIAGADEQHYVFLAEMPPSPHGDWLANPAALFWRFGAVVVTAGIVCYALARYLTAPIRRLRTAARQLADGDLAVRVGAIAGLRHDELGDLGRDFDFMAERLESLVSAQRRLLRDISHELRSPLARLNVALGLARQHAAPASIAALDRIELEAERLNGLIEQLLTLVSLEGRSDGGDRAEIHLDEMVREIVADASFESAGLNRSVRIVRCDECVARGTAAMLHSAIENVVRNAVQYTANDTDVEVSLVGPSDAARGSGEARALIEVRDYGPGVPEASVQDIFRPFYRVADARDRESGGVGLGLAITEQAIRLHGGTVRASNAADGGLIFRIELPCI
jgi:signal transduction histidine kinase